MVFDNKLLEILACPVCKGKLSLNKQKDALICRFDRLSYPIKEGIPVLIETEASSLSSEDIASIE